MANLSNNETGSSSAPVNENKFPIISFWRVLLLVYLILFASTGYLAFVNIERLPPTEELREYIEENDPAFRQFFLDALTAEDTERAQRQILAVQSFNVVLGALLGFLSASAASLTQRRNNE